MICQSLNNRANHFVLRQQSSSYVQSFEGVKYLSRAHTISSGLALGFGAGFSAGWMTNSVVSNESIEQKHQEIQRFSLIRRSLG